jgi:RNA polymerase sigma-70 factor (ECF subfamily)
VRDPSDRPLVDGLRRGDRRAFDDVFEKYRARVHAFLRRLSGRADVADDLFQEVWLKLARAAPRLHDDTDLAAWLFTVARNAQVSWRRWSMLDVSRLVALDDEPVFAPADARPDRRLESVRAVVAIERALQSLSAKDREVLLLVGVEGFSSQEAAAILDVRYDAFRQRLSRARDKLAAALRMQEQPEPDAPEGARS